MIVPKQASISCSVQAAYQLASVHHLRGNSARVTAAIATNEEERCIASASFFPLLGGADSSIETQDSAVDKEPVSGASRNSQRNEYHTLFGILQR